MCSGAVLSCQKMAFWTPSYFLYSGAVFRFKKTAFWTTSDFLCSGAVLSFQKTAFWTPSDFVLLRYSPLLSENGVLNAIWFCFTQVLSLVVRKWCSKRQLILFYLGTLLSCPKTAFLTPSDFVLLRYSPELSEICVLNSVWFSVLWCCPELSEICVLNSIWFSLLFGSRRRKEKL